MDWLRAFRLMRRARASMWIWGSSSGYDRSMRAVAWGFVGLAAAFGLAVLALDTAGNLEPIRILVLGGCICLAIAAPLLFIADHRRKKQATPL
jgi:hypothetical protein